eukprot:scaffold76364_cov47-Prasinocladus_malaysianus.AAC.1
MDGLIIRANGAPHQFTPLFASKAAAFLLLLAHLHSRRQNFGETFSDPDMLLWMTFCTFLAMGLAAAEFAQNDDTLAGIMALIGSVWLLVFSTYCTTDKHIKQLHHLGQSTPDRSPESSISNGEDILRAWRFGGLLSITASAVLTIGCLVMGASELWLRSA